MGVWYRVLRSRHKESRMRSDSGDEERGMTCHAPPVRDTAARMSPLRRQGSRRDRGFLLSQGMTGHA